MAVAALCFLVVLAAIGWGIYEVYKIATRSRQIITADEGHPSCGHLTERF